MSASVTSPLPRLGFLFALSSAASYGLMSFLVHFNPSHYPPAQLAFVRGALSVLILFPFCFREIIRFFDRDSHFLWIRSISGAVGVIFYFETLQGTTSANANLLFSSSPIFVAFFSWFLFRLRMNAKEVLGILFIIFANVLLYLPNQSHIENWVWVMGSIGSLITSVAFLSLGEATKKYSSFLIVLGFSFMSAIISLLSPGPSWPIIPMNADLFFFLAIALLGLFSQWTATISFAHLKSPVATALGRTSILFSGMLDMGIGRYRPHFFEILSYFVVIIGIALTNASEKRAQASNMRSA